jgi:hypothetical protein
MSEEKKNWLLNTGDDLYKNCKDFFPIGIDPDLTPSDIPSAIISSIEKVADDKFKLEVTTTLRGSTEENSAAEQALTFRIKYFLSKGDTFTLRFNDYDVDDEDLNSYYFGDDDEFDEDDLDSSDEDDEEYVEEIDLDSEDDDEDEVVEDEIFDIDDDFDDYTDDELDENFLFSVGVQHFTVKDIDWNTITLEYSTEDEDDFEVKE